MSKFPKLHGAVLTVLLLMQAAAALSIGAQSSLADDLLAPPTAFTTSSISKDTTVLACFRLLKVSRKKAIICFAVNIIEITAIEYAMCVVLNGDAAECATLKKTKPVPQDQTQQK